jgi:hypothetical protein
MNQPRNFKVSQFISSGSWAHRESPFAKLNWGFNSTEPSENVLSSTWLWRSLEQKELVPRFAMGFPEEWFAFQKTDGSESLLKKCHIDLWVFQTLDNEKQLQIAQIINEYPSYRIVIAANHLSNWRTLLDSPILKQFFISNHAYVSFLPSQNELDPFLTPQEVLWQLKDLPPEVPVLIQDFPKSHPSFFQSLKSEDLSLHLKKTNPFMLRTLQLLDKAGLENIILFIESLLNFLVSSRKNRLFKAIGHLFDLAPWRRKLNMIRVYIWDRALRPGAISIWFKFLLPVLYPIRKLYWFTEYQYKKRVVSRRRYRGH